MRGAAEAAGFKFLVAPKSDEDGSTFNFQLSTFNFSQGAAGPPPKKITKNNN
jgi:hypothetical protein